MMDDPEPLHRATEGVPEANVAFARTLKTNCVALVWMNELRLAGIEKKMSLVESLEVYVDKLSGWTLMRLERAG
jgi:hypothetical protein